MLILQVNIYKVHTCLCRTCIILTLFHKQLTVPGSGVCFCKDWNGRSWGHKISLFKSSLLFLAQFLFFCLRPPTNSLGKVWAELIQFIPGFKLKYSRAVFDSVPMASLRSYKQGEIADQNKAPVSCHFPLIYFTVIITFWKLAYIVNYKVIYVLKMYYIPSMKFSRKLFLFMCLQ